MNKLRVRVNRNFCTNTVDLYLATFNEDGSIESAAEEMYFSPKSQGSISKPAIQMHPEAAQMLMNELWQAGIRPAEEFRATESTLAAQKYHLEDMRKLSNDLIEKLVFERCKR